MGTSEVLSALRRIGERANAASRKAKAVEFVCSRIRILPAEDAGEWKEEDHKRDERGRFAHYDRCREGKHDFSKERKLIFTDFDGVLTDKSHGYMTARDPAKYHHVKELTERLKSLAQRTGAKIVIASNWRKKGRNESIEFEKALPGKKFQNPIPALLEDLGDLAVGFLPNGPSGGKKADAYAEWQKAHPEFSGTAIFLDDQNREMDAYHGKGLSGQTVKTGSEQGLTDEHCAQAEALLEDVASRREKVRKLIEDDANDLHLRHQDENGKWQADDGSALEYEKKFGGEWLEFAKLDEKWFAHFTGKPVSGSVGSSIGRLLDHVFEHGHNTPFERAFLTDIQSLLDNPHCVRHDTSTDRGSGLPRDSLLFMRYFPEKKTTMTMIIGLDSDTNRISIRSINKNSKGNPAKTYHKAPAVFMAETFE